MFEDNLPWAVTTITPLRISFAGGGTDISSFYRKNGGAVVSTTIDKYIYVTVKRHSELFQENYRLSYSKTEHTNSLEEIENDIARECLRLVPVKPPLYISTAADLPASSGLGSSSSFAVGLLNALHAMRGERVSAGQLAEEACHVEIEILQKPIGKQDQYAAAFGGLNLFQFEKNNRVKTEHIWIPNDGISKIFNNLALYWTGLQRDASSILKEQVNKMATRETEMLSLLASTRVAYDILVSDPFSIRDLGNLLHCSWQQKRKLASSISNEVIDSIYTKAMTAGCLGGKLAGAGGGGFLILVIDPAVRDTVRTALHDYHEVNVRYEPQGSRVLFRT